MARKNKKVTIYDKAIKPKQSKPQLYDTICGKGGRAVVIEVKDDLITAHEVKYGGGAYTIDLKSFMAGKTDFTLLPLPPVRVYKLSKRELAQYQGGR